jgi:hypothetical protein
MFKIKNNIIKLRKKMENTKLNPDLTSTKEVIEFEKITKECIALYAKKNADYGNSFDQGIDALGIGHGVSRLYDKMSRLIQLHKNNEHAHVEDETLDDTLRDLACYAIMIMSYRRRNPEKIK